MGSRPLCTITAVLVRREVLSTLRLYLYDANFGAKMDDDTRRSSTHSGGNKMKPLRAVCKAKGKHGHLSYNPVSRLRSLTFTTPALINYDSFYWSWTSALPICACELVRAGTRPLFVLSAEVGHCKHSTVIPSVLWANKKTKSVDFHAWIFWESMPRTKTVFTSLLWK